MLGTVLECLPSTNAVVWPKVSPEDIRGNKTTLGRILSRGHVIVISRRINEGSRGDYSTEIPTGASPDFEAAVVTRIGVHFGVPTLNIKYFWFVHQKTTRSPKLTSHEYLQGRWGH